VRQQNDTFIWLKCIKVSLDVSAKKLPRDVKPEAVFACNELDLSEVKVYGFDYDYTLACYKSSLDDLLYNLGKDNLINKFKVIRMIADYFHVLPDFVSQTNHEKSIMLFTFL